MNLFKKTRKIFIDKNKIYGIIRINERNKIKNQEVKIKMPYIEYDQNTGYFFPPYIEDLISKDHVGRAINKVVEMLDISELLKEEKAEGRRAYHPRMMLKIIIYGYSQKAYSSRLIDKGCCEDVVYMWLSGMQRPDFRTISRFRKDNIEVLKALFKQVVQICQKLGIVKLGLVAIDGTKVKAVASDYKAKTEDALKEALKSVEEDIEKYLRDGITIDEAEDILYGKDRSGFELSEEAIKNLEKKGAIEKAIEEIKWIKETDKTKKKDPKINPVEEEARFMKHSGGRIQLSYNAQIAVEENGIIVAAEITNEANDKRQMVSMLKEVEEITGAKPEKAIFDAGYYSKDNLEETKDSGTECYVTSKKWEEEIKEKESEVGSIISKGDVDEASDCNEVAGPILTTSTNNLTENSEAGSLVEAEGIADASKKCDKEKDVVEEMAKKLQSEEGKEIYRKRKWIVEPVFGQIKCNLGFNRFRLKGIKKARGEWLLECICHNIKKINNWLLDKGEKLGGGEFEKIKNSNLGIEIERELVCCSI